MSQEQVLDKYAKARVSLQSHPLTTTGRPKELDSVMVGIHYTVSELIRDIILHYKPPPANLLDPMCGNGVFYKLWSAEEMGYSTYFSDLEKTTFTQTVHDVLEIERHYSKRADIIVFDPPYPINEAGNWSRKKNEMRRYTQGQIKTRQDFQAFVGKVDKVFRRIISDKGIIIAKVQDVHKDGQFIPYHILLTEWLKSFELYDIVIYRNFYNRAPWGSKYAHNTHSYFLILKPILNQKLLETQTT